MKVLNFIWELELILMEILSKNDAKITFYRLFSPQKFRHSLKAEYVRVQGGNRECCTNPKNS